MQSPSIRKIEKDYPGIIEANQVQNKAYREEMIASLADRPLTTPDRYDYQLTFVKERWQMGSGKSLY